MVAKVLGPLAVPALDEQTEMEKTVDKLTARRLRLMIGMASYSIGFSV